ncbi:MAG: hypothetical protein ACRDTC_08140 [Pseudonocardiaceae bacterium]
MPCPNTPERYVPGWLRVVLLIASAPIMVGAVGMVYQAGISTPVLIGAIVGPLAGLAWRRRRTPPPPP